MAGPLGGSDCRKDVFGHVAKRAVGLVRFGGVKVVCPFVLNLKGRLVKKLLNVLLPAASQDDSFLRKNRLFRRFGKGFYFYLCLCGQFVQSFFVRAGQNRKRLAFVQDFFRAKNLGLYAKRLYGIFSREILCVYQMIVFWQVFYLDAF